MERLRQLTREIYRRSLWQVLGMLPALVFAGTSVSAQADDALVEWVRENGVRLTSVEAGSGFEDLQNLRPLLESARLVALGEPLQGCS